MLYKSHKNAIALLITVMFVIVISVAIGLGLKQINNASKSVQEEKFSYQISLLLEDVLHMLQNSNDLKQIADTNNSIDDFSLFLMQTQMIPFSTKGIDVLIKVQSARRTFNVSDMNDSRRADYLVEYLNKYGINSDYVTMLFDIISGIKEDGNYNTTLFEQYPSLFRSYLASYQHLEVLNRFYEKEMNDNSLKNVDFTQLFYCKGRDTNATHYKIDLNYATPEVWEMMLGCSQEKAKLLAEHDDLYEKKADLHLEPQELSRLQAYKYSFFEPYLDVEVRFLHNESEAKISFEYDIREKKGYNFVYEI